MLMLICDTDAVADSLVLGRLSHQTALLGCFMKYALIDCVVLPAREANMSILAILVISTAIRIEISAYFDSGLFRTEGLVLIRLPDRRPWRIS